MTPKIQPAGEGSSSFPSSNTTVKEKRRAEYNPNTKTFEPMKGGETKKTQHLENVEDKVTKVPVPTDYSSPTYLKKVLSKTTAKADQLTFDTNGVGAFLSGNGALYTNFISSVSKAQDLL